jgi:hypothetical protein
MRAWVLAALMSTALPAAAVDPFEIQVYDGTANPPGTAGLELHLNYVARGLQEAAPPELAMNHQAHATLEPSLGITPFWEIGAYLQSALRPDGTFEFAGAKLRSKFVTPPGWNAHWRLGVNLEVSLLPRAYDRSRWGGEVRPIAAWEDDRWLLAINPIISLALGAPDASAGPELEPAAMAKVKLGPIAVGIEYYASIGPLSSPLPFSAQEHYLFQAIDVIGWERVEINFAVGEGLTNGSNGLVIKSIIGYRFGGL